MALITEYRVTINGTGHGTHTRLTDAIRAWDRVSYNTVVESGDITVQTWDAINGNMLRDGNILRVENGNIYLSPNLSDGLF